MAHGAGWSFLRGKSGDFTWGSIWLVGWLAGWVMLLARYCEGNMTSNRGLSVKPLAYIVLAWL